MINNPQKFVALLSSGLDSPIAAYLMLKQGYNAILLSYNVSNPDDNLFASKIGKIARHLQELTNRKLTLHLVNHQGTLQHFVENGKRKLTCILCKTYMLTGASILAEQYHADFIVNGDILGEQASQTLHNIAVIQQNRPHIPVIRPLVGFDKQDVLKLSHELGFYELSQLPDVQCTYNPLYPETHTHLPELQESLERVNLESLARSNLNNAQILIVD